MIAYLLIHDINPVPWQSPDLGIGRGKNGKVFPTATSPANMKAYQAALRESIAQAHPEYHKEHTLFPPKRQLSVFFFYWRSLDVYTKNGRRQTGHRADTSNLNKATEDALQGWLYHNDVDNKIILGSMVEQSSDVDPPMLLVVAADVDHRHVLPALLDDDFVTELAKNLIEAIDPPMPPGNVRLRVTK